MCGRKLARMVMSMTVTLVLLADLYEPNRLIRAGCRLVLRSGTGCRILVHEVRDHALGGVFEAVAVVHPDAGVIGHEGDVVGLVGQDVE